MVNKQLGKKVSLLVFISLISVHTVQPVSKQMAKLASIVSGLVVAVPSLFFIHRTREGQHHQLDAKNVGLSVLAVGAGAGLAKLVYDKMSYHTPEAKFARVSDEVEKIQKMHVASITSDEAIRYYQELDVQRAVLKKIEDEIGTKKQYTTLSQQVRDLKIRTSEIYVEIAKRLVSKVERDERIAQLFDASTQELSDADYLEYIQSLPNAPISWNEVRMYLARAEESFLAAQQGFLSYIVQHAKQNQRTSMYDTIQAQENALAVLIHYIIGRKELVKSYTAYTNAARGLEDLQTSAIDHWLFEPSRTEPQFIEYVKEIFPYDNWHQRASAHLGQESSTFTQHAQLLNEVLGGRQYFFSEDAQEVHQSVIEVSNKLRGAHRLIDKVSVLMVAQQRYDQVLAESRLASLFQSDEQVTDAIFWNWALQNYASGWQSQVKREVRKVIAPFRSGLNSVARTSNNVGQFLNDEREQLTQRLNRALQQCEVYLFLAEHYTPFINIRNEYERFISRSIVSQLLLARNEPSLSTIIRRCSAANTDPWPLIVAATTLDQEITTVSNLRRDITRLLEDRLPARHRTRLVQTLELERDILRKLDRLNMIHRTLVDSREYRNQINDRDNYQRQQEQARRDRERQARERREREERNRRQNNTNNQPNNNVGNLIPGDIQTECTICLDDYNNNDNIVVTRCAAGRHVYHRQCFANWRANHTTCPICRHNTPGEEFMTYQQYVQRH